MQSYVIWVIVGLVLVTIEMMTGTFYLLVLGAAAFAAALTAYLAWPFLSQVLVAAVVAVVGVVAVNRWHRIKRAASGPERSLDIGQRVEFESWVDERARLVRVKYRGASWDARLIDEAKLHANDVLTICGTEGSLLQVSRNQPR